MSFPIRTERLVLRPPVPEDLGALMERRNDPLVAELQDWETPYPQDRAQAIVNSHFDAPPIDEWCMLTVTDGGGEIIFGDVVLRLGDDGRSAEVGYTFAAKHWGNGYAVEAVEALIDYLFTQPGMTRVQAMLHPDNMASAQVLERTGFKFEGHTRLSYFLGSDNSDNWIYGMTQADYEGWRGRPRHRPEEVRLVEITPDNSRAVGALVTHKSQERFVAPVVYSFRDALLPELIDGYPVEPWFRAIEADGELSGFVMLALSTVHHPEPYLWRFLIDSQQQRRGIGTKALDLVVDECRARGNKSLCVSWVEGRGSPRPLYTAYGFIETGNIVDGETEARLQLDKR